jgi:hypothetical protein
LQEAVKQLRPGQALAFVKDPTNPYDPLAVRIETLAGTHLGYVPRSMTQLFPHEVSSGGCCEGVRQVPTA